MYEKMLGVLEILMARNANLLVLCNIGDEKIKQKCKGVSIIEVGSHEPLKCLVCIFG